MSANTSQALALSFGRWSSMTYRRGEGSSHLRPVLRIQLRIGLSRDAARPSRTVESDFQPQGTEGGQSAHAYHR